MIGEWAESFELRGQDSWTVAHFQAQWRGALRRLVELREPAALLLDAPGGAHLRAWVCYPEGERVYVQFRDFVIGETAIELHEDGWIAGIEPRETFTDYGLPIPERYCELADIRQYLVSPD